MEMKSAYITLLIFLMGSSSFAEIREPSLITFAPWPSLSESKNDQSLIEKKWNELDEEIRKRIQSILLMDLGLSSTGHIEAIGCYTLTRTNQLGKEGDRIFHFIQRDLMGSRLFWSCLINTDSMKIQKIYPTSDLAASEQVKPFKLNP
jgi:hypothetical protein